MIQSARRRLVVIAPALFQAVANALVARFDELADLDIRVIVDADAEVYRHPPHRLWWHIAMPPEGGIDASNTAARS